MNYQPCELLGASLYVPANHKNLFEFVSSNSLTSLRSIIVCTEDSIRENEVEWAIQRLPMLLHQIKEPRNCKIFIRPRNETVLQTILENESIERISGFVLPKVSLENLPRYFKILDSYPHHKIMITLETKEIFDIHALQEMRTFFMDSTVRKKILALRIGGNDLLNILGMRRPKNFTIYDTPLAWVMGQIVSVFAPDGFNITAPVFERLDNEDLLRQELDRDLAFGFVGKTAIHPSQVDIINSYFSINPMDRSIAEALLSHDSPAVFKMHGAMCEVSTHRSWAEKLIHNDNYLNGTLRTLPS